MPRVTSRAALAILLALCLVVASATPAFASPKRAGARAARPTGLHAALSGPADPTPGDVWDTGDDTPAGARDLSLTPELHNFAYRSTDPGFYDYDIFVTTMTAGHVYRVRTLASAGALGPGDPMIDVYKKSEVDTLPLAPPGDPDYLSQWPSRLEVDNTTYTPGGGSTGSSQVCFSPTETARYYVVVKEGWNSFGGGQYSITGEDLGAVDPGTVSRTDGMAGYGLSDRYSVAAALAEEVGASQGTTHPANVIIASGLDRAAADPLSAGSLSGLYDAPILLVRGDWPARLPAATATYLFRLKNAHAGPISFSIVGGPASVPETLKKTVLGLSPAGSKFVARYTGADRYVVAAAVAAKVRSITGTSAVCFVTNGQTAAYFYDTLAASALAAHKRYPILLTKSTVVPPSTLAESKRYATRIVVANTAVITPATYAALKGTMRIGYDYSDWCTYDRQYMARLVADYGSSRGWVSNSEAGLANKLADSLVGGAAMGRLGGALLFTDDAWMNAEWTEGWVDQLRPSSAHVYVIGGTVSVTLPVILRLQELLGTGG